MKFKDQAETRSKEGAGRVDKRALKSRKLRFRFRLYPDQAKTLAAALELARSELDTESDVVALEAICMGYLAGAIAIHRVPGE